MLESFGSLHGAGEKWIVANLGGDEGGKPAAGNEAHGVDSLYITRREYNCENFCLFSPSNVAQFKVGLKRYSGKRWWWPGCERPFRKALVPVKHRSITQPISVHLWLIGTATSTAPVSIIAKPPRKKGYTLYPSIEQQQQSIMTALRSQSAVRILQSASVPRLAMSTVTQRFQSSIAKQDEREITGVPSTANQPDYNSPHDKATS